MWLLLQVQGKVRRFPLVETVHQGVLPHITECSQINSDASELPVTIFRTRFRKQKNTKLRICFKRVFLKPLKKEIYQVRSSYAVIMSKEQLVKGMTHDASLCFGKLNILTKRVTHFKNHAFLNLLFIFVWPSLE